MQNIPKINNKIKENSEEYEKFALIDPSGFREYDVRWILGEKLNLLGVQRLGFALGHYIQKNSEIKKIIVGHDYRAYSVSVKHSLCLGLLNAGIEIIDIGLSITPMLYFSQFHLGIANGAMITASHNENGWTGVKLSDSPPSTFGPDKIIALKELAYAEDLPIIKGGSYQINEDVKQAYIDDVCKNIKPERKIRAVVACGNGTAAAFAEEILTKMNIEIIPMDCELDFNFPNYNPNPEDMKMLHKMADKVKENNADIAFGFDGDGDRCGVVDENGNEIFSDKIGLLLARNISNKYHDSKFVVDVKSTGLYRNDEILKKNNCSVEYFKTGHSYIKSRTFELGAIAGFEKSGHFFFSPPLGRGYDDAFVAAAAIIDLLDNNKDKSLSQLYADLPHTYQSPSLARHCPDEEKYNVIDAIKKIIKDKISSGMDILGQKIVEVNEINGIRFTLEDGSFGLIRASSNKPELVIVIEATQKEEVKMAIYNFLNEVMANFDLIGDYNQSI